MPDKNISGRENEGARYREARVPSRGRYHSSYSGTDITAVLTTKNNAYPFAEMSTITYSMHREKALVRPLGFSAPKGYTYGPRTVAGSLVFLQFDEDMIYRAMAELDPSTRIVPDELPPFHITVYFNDEFGKKSYLTIHNITIVDNGQVMSVEDLVVENTMSYYASDVTLMRSVDTVITSKEPLQKTILQTPQILFVDRPIVEEQEEPSKNPKDILRPTKLEIKGRILDSGSPATNARILINQIDMGSSDQGGNVSIELPLIEDDFTKVRNVIIHVYHNGLIVETHNFLLTPQMLRSLSPVYDFGIIQIPSTKYLDENDTLEFPPMDLYTPFFEVAGDIAEDLRDKIQTEYTKLREAIAEYASENKTFIDYKHEDVSTLKDTIGSYVLEISNWEQENPEHQEVGATYRTFLTSKLLQQVLHFLHHPLLVSN